jgi:hypothetical protein
VKHSIRPTAGISREQWRRIVVARSLKMMVRSGVLRRADIDPPRVHFNPAQGGSFWQGGDETPPNTMAEPGWFARIFLSREFLLRHHH